MLKQKDEFLQGEEYASQWGYILDKDGTVPIVKPFDIIKYKDRQKPLNNYNLI